jgi:hypothetical protein
MVMRMSRRHPTSRRAEAALDELVESGLGTWVTLPTRERGETGQRAFRLAEARPTKSLSDVAGSPDRATVPTGGHRELGETSNCDRGMVQDARDPAATTGFGVDAVNAVNALNGPPGGAGFDAVNHVNSQVRAGEAGTVDAAGGVNSQDRGLKTGPVHTVDGVGNIAGRAEVDPVDAASRLRSALLRVNWILNGAAR